MKTETICQTVPCDISVLERPRYFPRQLITPDDLILEQDYFRDKLRRHNRLLHGWGVVCGALVCLVPKKRVDNGNKKTEGEKNGNDNGSGNGYEAWKVVVRPGYILGPYGDEIYIDCPRVVDIRTMGKTDATGDACVEVPDPWCTEPMEEKQPGDVYVAVRYKEILTRPVRVQPVGCGCDDTQCEYSRLRDGYEIKILACCPESHKNVPNWDELNKGHIPECPSCPEDAWVVLAKVTFKADGTITGINNCECRRMVHALGHYWWRCEDGLKAPEKESNARAREPARRERAAPRSRRRREVNNAKE